MAQRVLALRLWLNRPVSPGVRAALIVGLWGLSVGMMTQWGSDPGGSGATWRCPCLMFGLFGGLSALCPVATGGIGRRSGVVGVTVLALGLGLTDVISPPAIRAFAIAAAVLGILAGQGAQALVAMLARPDARATPEEVEAEAIRWFLRLHADAKNSFDWTQFDGWIRRDRHHREAYEWVEGLWYRHRDGPSRRMRYLTMDCLGLVGLGGAAGRIRLTVMVAGACLAVVGAYG